MVSVKHRLRIQPLLFISDVPISQECFERLFGDCGKVEAVYLQDKPTSEPVKKSSSKYFFTDDKAQVSLLTEYSRWKGLCMRHFQLCLNCSKCFFFFFFTWYMHLKAICQRNSKMALKVLLAKQFKLRIKHFKYCFDQ